MKNKNFSKIIDIIKNSNILKTYFNNKRINNERMLLINNILSFQFNEEIISKIKKEINDTLFQNQLKNSYNLLLQQIENQGVKREININQHFIELVNIYDKELLRILFFIISNSNFNMSSFYISKILSSLTDKEKIKTIIEIIIESDFNIIKNIDFFENIYLNNILKIEDISVKTEFKKSLTEFLYFILCPLFSENRDIRRITIEKIYFYLNKFKELVFSTIREKIVIQLQDFKIKKRDSLASLLELCYYDIIIFSENDQILRDLIVGITEDKDIYIEQNFKKICDHLDSFLNIFYKKYSLKMESNVENSINFSNGLFKEDSNQEELNSIFQNLDSFFQNIIKKILEYILNRYSKNRINIDVSQTVEKILNLLMRENLSTNELNEDKILPLEDSSYVYNPEEKIEEIPITENQKPLLTEKSENILGEKEIENKIEKKSDILLDEIVTKIIKELKGSFDINKKEDMDRIIQLVKEIALDRKNMGKSIIDKAIKESLSEEEFESL